MWDVKSDSVECVTDKAIPHPLHTTCPQQPPFSPTLPPIQYINSRFIFLRNSTWKIRYTSSDLHPTHSSQSIIKEYASGLVSISIAHTFLLMPVCSVRHCKFNALSNNFPSSNPRSNDCHLLIPEPRQFPKPSNLLTDGSEKQPTLSLPRTEQQWVQIHTLEVSSI